MNSDYFVDKDSIVRQIWGKSDTILFIFAGAAAEFALNKSVDWLYFTGKLPSDPLGRLFSTVGYARKIVFAKKVEASNAIETMAKIHNNVESKLGAKIPDWAYRDVLFMLIDYSIRAHEALEHTLSLQDKEDVFDVFYRVGHGMGIKGLPTTFMEWTQMRENHLENNLEYSHYSNNLFQQYKKHLGPIRYFLLIETQRLLVPKKVLNLLKIKRNSVLKPLISVYKVSRSLNIEWLLKNLLLPPKYRKQIKQLDIINPQNTKIFAQT